MGSWFLGRRELHKEAGAGHKKEHAPPQDREEGRSLKERYLPAGSQGRSGTVESANGSPHHGRRMKARTGRVLVKALSPRSGSPLTKVSSSWKGQFPVFFQSSSSPVMLIIILCTWHRQLHFYEFSITFCHSLDNSMRFIKTSWKIHTLGPECQPILPRCHPVILL